MTRKDFEIIAEVIKDEVETCRDADGFKGLDVAVSLAHRFCTRLRAVNPRFDRKRFLAACGLGED